MLQVRIKALEAQLDAVLMQNADLCRENEQLRDSLASEASLLATCEALGL